MKRFYNIFFAICLLLGLAVSCMDERLPEDYGQEGRPVDVVLHFGGSGAMTLEPTKTSLGIDQESTVYNLYVFIFDSSGKKIYGKYFDYTNCSTSGASTFSDWWEVTNNYRETAESDPVTSGTIHMHTVARRGCTIVAISNIDAEMVNISPEQLGMVSTYSDIFGQSAKLNQLIVSRSGYFPMSGEIRNVNTGADISGTLTLRRLDAKVKFRVHVKAGSKIASFTPLKWRVCNLPKQAYVLERGEYYGNRTLTAAEQASLIDAAGVDASNYFDLGETNFETEELTDDFYSGSTLNKIMVHGFSFYMMENRKAPKATPAEGWTEYRFREQQDKNNKTGEGTSYSTVKNGDFTYANELSPYVVITGRVVMDNVSYGDSEGATLSGDVKYIVHLGDFSDGKYGDFNIFRNHTYIYDITINDVNDIRVEVENNYDDNTGNNFDEGEPGATGTVSVSMEEIYTSDSHYSSHVVTFHAKNIDADKVTWVVQTPFNPSGASPVVLADGTENTSGIDFEWVEFRVNDKDDDGVYFDAKRQIYKPITGEFSDGKTMNITGMVAYLKKQKRLFDAGLPNDFDQDIERNEDGTPKLNGEGQTIPNPKISVTAFVNEYYYEKNPITGDYQKALWKSFVNQPMRFMHILSETKISADGESRIIGSSFTIQQKSIQSIYNIDNPNLESAWGCEHVTDQLEEGKRKYNVNTSSQDRGNTSLTNGRLNSVKEWGLVDKNGANSIMGDITEANAYWETYMNLQAENETPIMLDAYQYLRYSCMSRNRDNNGNGLIDQDEVRWYMAASNQLIGLFMGGYGIEGAARLYQRSLQERQSTDAEVWRQHVIASTRYPGRNNSNNNARVSWAEEGVNGSDISFTDRGAGATTYFSTRCVRNLGYDAENNCDLTDSPLTSEPENYIQVRRMRNGEEYPLVNPSTGKNQAWDKYVYYEFDCSRINEASLRYYTDRELVPHDENDEAACLYRKFVVASKADSETRPTSTINGYNAHYINQLNAYLDDTNNIGENPFCPTGYRLPNVREDAVLWSFIPSTDFGSFLQGVVNHSRTHWSFGVSGVNNKRQGKNFWGWAINNEKMLMAIANNNSTNYLRCVKDVKD